jgi:hypothetical protein
VCYYTCEGPNHAAFLSAVQLDVFLFRTFFLFTLVLLRPLGGVIFIFGPGMYFQTGQVIFVPEWPNGGVC